MTPVFAVTVRNEHASEDAADWVRDMSRAVVFVRREDAEKCRDAHAARYTGWVYGVVELLAVLYPDDTHIAWLNRVMQGGAS